MSKTLLTAIATAAIVAAGATAEAQASPCRTVKACRAQIVTLKRVNATLRLQRNAARAQRDALAGQVDTLNGQVDTMTSERDQARSQLATAQSGVAGALSTMTPAAIWPLFRSPIASVYSTPRYSNSYFSSGSDYASWTFTFCGFC